MDRIEQTGAAATEARAAAAKALVRYILSVPPEIAARACEQLVAEVFRDPQP